MFQMRLNGITRLKEQTAVLALALLVQVVPLLTVKLSIQIFSGWTLIICGMVVALTGGYQTFFHNWEIASSAADCDERCNEKDGCENFFVYKYNPKFCILTTGGCTQEHWSSWWTYYRRSGNPVGAT